MADEGRRAMGDEGGRAVSTRPTTISKLESKLCEHGHRSDGVLALHPDACEDGHGWYPEFMTMQLDGTAVDFTERHTEDKVEMRTTLTPEQLVRVAEVLAETHRSKQHGIGVGVIVTVTTALAVCDELRGSR